MNIFWNYTILGESSLLWSEQPDWLSTTGDRLPPKNALKYRRHMEYKT